MMRPVFAVPTRIVAQVGFFAPMNLRTTVWSHARRKTAQRAPLAGPQKRKPTEGLSVRDHRRSGGCVFKMGLRDRDCPTHAR